MELVVAIGMIALIAGLTITTISVIPQTRMKNLAQTFKTEFELTRSFAKTHGGDASFTLKKIDGGVQILRTSKLNADEEKEFKDGNLTVYYKLTGDTTEYELGVTDPATVKEKTLTMTFAQTTGKIIGPNKVDYFIFSNGSKNYKFILDHGSGMIYFDYELEDHQIPDNENLGSSIIVSTPTFVRGGAFYTTATEMTYTGKAIQPELNYDARYVKISGVYRAIEKGVYEIEFILKDPYLYTWDDGTVENKYLTWKIK